MGAVVWLTPTRTSEPSARAFAASASEAGATIERRRAVWRWVGWLMEWEPVHGGELVCGPDEEDDQEDEAGEIDGAAAAQAGGAADEDHGDVGQPHGEGEQDLGVAEVLCAVVLLRDDGADEQAGGHAGQAEEERLEGDLVDGLERRVQRREPARGRWTCDLRRRSWMR